jgi:hypothetical protein
MSGALVIFVLFIACISATSKDVQRKPLDSRTYPRFRKIYLWSFCHRCRSGPCDCWLGHSQLATIARYEGLVCCRANAAILQARAAIGVKLPKIILSRVDFGDAGAASLASRLQSPKIAISVTNYGQTPAFLLGQAIEIEVCALLPAKPEYPSAFDLAPETVVEYKNKYLLGTARLNSPLSPDDIQAILDGNTRLWVYGYVYYRNILSEPHMARFCKLFLPPSPPTLLNGQTSSSRMI